jgi:hypothetical protein
LSALKWRKWFSVVAAPGSVQIPEKAASVAVLPMCTDGVEHAHRESSVSVISGAAEYFDAIARDRIRRQ